MSYTDRYKKMMKNAEGLKNMDSMHEFFNTVTIRFGRFNVYCLHHNQLKMKDFFSDILLFNPKIRFKFDELRSLLCCKNVLTFLN